MPARAERAQTQHAALYVARCYGDCAAGRTGQRRKIKRNERPAFALANGMPFAPRSLGSSWESLHARWR